MRAIFFCATFLVLTGCEVAATTGSEADAQASTASLSNDLKSLAKGSCSRNSDCLNAGMGVKGCGGPEEYLTFSKWDSLSKIFEKLEAYNTKRAKDNEGLISTCEYRMPPKVSCVSNKCTQASNNSGLEVDTLGIVSGEITLNIPRLADLPSMTFKNDDNKSVTFYLKLSSLDYNTRTKLESYRKTTVTVKVRVKIFAVLEEGDACEFMNASCSTRVSVYNVRSMKIISVR